MCFPHVPRWVGNVVLFFCGVICLGASICFTVHPMSRNSFCLKNMFPDIFKAPATWDL